VGCGVSAVTRRGGGEAWLILSQSRSILIPMGMSTHVILRTVIAADCLTKPNLTSIYCTNDAQPVVFDTQHDCELVIKMRADDARVQAIRDCIDKAASRKGG
jgi:hypothetical protein